MHAVSLTAHAGTDGHLCCLTDGSIRSERVNSVSAFVVYFKVHIFSHLPGLDILGISLVFYKSDPVLVFSADVEANKCLLSPTILAHTE